MRSLAAVLFAALLVLQAVHGARRDLIDGPVRTLLQEEETEEEPEQEEEAAPEPTHNRFNYQQAGLDWPETYPDCDLSSQSPINIITSEIGESDANELHARMGTFGVGNTVSVFNNRQAVEVTWEDTIETSVLLPVVGGMVYAAVDPLDPAHEGQLDLSNNATFSFANVQLLQLHFHISSENAIDGVLYPLEAHLVARVSGDNAPGCGEDGCIVVFATLFKIVEDKVNFFLEPFIDAAPDHAGEEHAKKMPEGFQLIFDEMMPAKKSFYTWKGSFTTPPCTEGVTWILFDEIGTISQRQLSRLQASMAIVRESCMKEAGGNVQKMEDCMFIGDLKNNRALQPLNSRRVEHVGTVFAS